MKKYSFIYIFLVFYCMSLFSCKQVKNHEDNKHYFLSKNDTVTVITKNSSSVSDYTNPEGFSSAEKDRGKWQNPKLVIKKLGDLTGKVVADIGSGTGYFTFPMARQAKKVLAIDIEQRYLDYIENKKMELPMAQADNIETRLTEENEPNLHADEVDAVLMVNVFYYIKHRLAYMKIVNDALKDQGRLVLVDFKPGDLPVGPAENKLPAKEVVTILKLAGFGDIEVDSLDLEYQYIIVAK